MAGKEVKKGAGEMIVAQGIGIQTSGKDKENEGFQSLIEEPQNLKEGAGETIRETQISKMDLDKQRCLEAHHRLHYRDSIRIIVSEVRRDQTVVMGQGADEGDRTEQ